MAKRRRRAARYLNPSKTKNRQSSKKKNSKKNGYETVEFEISPETATEITAISLVLLGVLLVLSLTGVFGTMGVAINKFVHELFGWMAPVFAISLVVLGIIRFYPDKYKIGLANYLGFVMFNIWLPAAVHLFIDNEKAYEVALDGAGGGYIGYYIGTSLKNSVSFTGALVLLVAFIIISLLILFNTSFKHLQEKLEVESYKPGEFSPKQLSKLRINAPVGALKDRFGRLKVNGRELRNQPLGDTRGRENKKIINQENTEGGQPKIIKEEVDWNFPPMDLLEDSKYSVESGNVTGNAEIIANTLSQFGIIVTMQDVNIGPTFTQYTLKPAEGTKLSRITALQDDLALALATHPIRIEAPIPGKSLMGVEIPNKKVALVRLKEILTSGEYRSAVDRGNLVISLGKDVSGTPTVADLSKMPHLLVAGATGSGKSVCINGILASLLFQYSPKELRLIVVDPKRVEMTSYNGIAHLLTPAITEPDKTINAFRWAVLEMENRYKLLSEKGARDIAGYNKKLGKEEEKMPYIVIVVDELADVMLTAGQEMEGLVVRIAQMARAVGIHLVVATQRPSVDVVTGLIKANIPCRIAFRVASQVDSRTILDMAGAERLIGRGDMLFMAGDGQKPKRIQGVYVDDREINSILNNVKSQQEVQYNEDIVKPHKSPVGSMNSLGAGGEIDDDMYQEAYDLVVASGKASASLLQRRLRVGYARAARLLDLLEDQGVIGPGDGAKPREVLVARDDRGTAGIYDDEWKEEEE